MKASRVYSTAVLFLVAGFAWFQGRAVYGFVPSCEKEISQYYPPALKGDLSACAAKPPAFKPTAAADAGKFTHRLNGSWELKMRTVHGIVAETKQMSAKMYFDLSADPAGRISGAALLLESPNGTGILKASTTKPTALGFWDIAGSQHGKLALSVDMAGAAGNRYDPAGIRDVKGALFSELDNVFVSAEKASPNPASWDRVILADNVLIYVSCKQGMVERYAKASNQKPLVEGLNIKAYWQSLKDKKLIAMAGAPGLAR